MNQMPDVQMLDPLSAAPESRPPIDLRMGAPYSRLVGSQFVFAEALGDCLGVPRGCVLPAAGATGAIEIVRNHVLARKRGGPPSLLTVSPEYWRARESFEGLGFRLLDADTSAAGFDIDEESLQAAIEEARPDVAYASLPNNPTGAVFDPVTLVRGLDEATTVVLDLTLPRDDVATWDLFSDLFSELEGRENLYLVGSMSKGHRMAEQRVGWVVGTAAADVRQLHREHRNVISCEAARQAVEKLGAPPPAMPAIRESRDALESAEACGRLAIVKPRRRVATSYVLVELELPAGVSRKALESARVAVMWGSEIGLDDRYVRLEMSDPDGVKRFLETMSHLKPDHPELASVAN